jgi:hypothetical protein
VPRLGADAVVAADAIAAPTDEAALPPTAAEPAGLAAS